MISLSLSLSLRTHTQRERERESARARERERCRRNEDDGYSYFLQPLSSFYNYLLLQNVFSMIECVLYDRMCSLR